MIIVSKKTTDLEEGMNWLISKKVREYALANWTDFSRAKRHQRDEYNRIEFIIQIPESIADREAMFDLKGVHYI